MTGVALAVHADARRLPLADRCVHCVVTSPPYYGARDYTDSGQSLRGQTRQLDGQTDLLTALAELPKPVAPALPRPGDLTES